MNWLKGADKTIHGQLSKYAPGTASFDAAWKSIAAKNGSRFNELQHTYIKNSYYDPAVSKIKTSLGFDVNNFSPALQNVIWSVAVQHGTGGMMNILKNAGVKMPLSEDAMIRAIYKERSKVDKYFSKSSASVKKGVYNRFQTELQDALAML